MLGAGRTGTFDGSLRLASGSPTTLKITAALTSFCRRFDRAEGAFTSLALGLMVALLSGEMIARALFGVGIPGSQPIVQHLTLWVGFLGAALAAMVLLPYDADPVNHRWDLKIRTAIGGEHLDRQWRSRRQFFLGPR